LERTNTCMVFEVLTAMLQKILVFLDVTFCRKASSLWHFEGL